MKSIRISCLLACVLAASCTKVIELDLHDSAQQLVIEGNLTDQPGPYSVKLSESLQFNEPNNWPAVRGALITLTEAGGATDTLRETAPGWYTGSGIQGVPGHTYTLVVNVDGQVHRATRTMPVPVPLDTAYVQELTVPGAGTQLVPVFEFDDPPAVSNYYNLVARRDGYPLPGFYTLDDRARDGNRIIRPLRSNRFALQSGQAITAELQCLDQQVYDYFYVLGEAAGLGLNLSPTPANPTAQFDTDALGYFNVCSVSVKQIVIP